MKSLPGVVAFVVLTSLPWLAAGQSLEEPAPSVVRVAYTTWLSASGSLDDDGVQFMRKYLGNLEERSRASAALPPLRFEFGLGNYYQVLAWLRAGLIDAAIATPFVGALLEREGVGLSSFELATSGNAGYFPAIAATGDASDDPLAAYERYLAQILARAGEQTPLSDAEPMGERFRTHFVTHLSASGFVVPLIYAQRWLEERPFDPQVSGRFWDALIDDARFTLVHDPDLTDIPEGTTDLYFSYCSDLGTDGPCKESDQLQWFAYPVGRSGADGLITRAVPNEVFIIRSGFADAVRWPITEREIGVQLLDRALQDGQSSYGLQVLTRIVQSEFRTASFGLFFAGDPALEIRARRWFIDGQFDFTIDETMTFLRQDQRNSGIDQLALVLSGGGVKSLYQAELLGHLYSPAPGGDSPQLTNVTSPGATGTRPYSDDAPIPVRNIIGTSGGAILGFFVALLPDLSNLAERMDRIAAQRVFPGLALPRTVSFLALLGILLGATLVARAWSSNYQRDATPVEKGAPLLLLVASLLPFVGGVLALRFVRGADFENVSVAEGAFFVAALLVLHLTVTCAARDETARQRGSGHEGWLTVIFGAAVVAAAVSVALLFHEADARIYAQSIGPRYLSVLVGVGTLVMTLGVAKVAASGVGGLHLRDLRQYGLAMMVLGLFLTVSYGFLYVLVRYGPASLLELTWAFWGFLAFCGVVSAASFLLIAWKPWGWQLQERFRDGMIALMRDRVRGITMTMLSSLVMAGALGLGLWLVVVAPAAYSNELALAVLRAELDPTLRSRPFTTNLVVTGALLDQESCEASGTSLDAGGLYTCFGGGTGCRAARGSNWQVFPNPSAERALDAVFASGSAFPVFPRHLAHTPDGCEVRLIDGGYAHNVPLDAAKGLGSRQVLIVNASPDEIDDGESLWSLASQLARGSPRLLSFMFERAQALDQSAAGSLLVASLGPRSDPNWPWLLDFRPAARTLVQEQARENIREDRRIGRILNWGLPELVGPD